MVNREGVRNGQLSKSSQEAIEFLASPATKLFRGGCTQILHFHIFNKLRRWHSMKIPHTSQHMKLHDKVQAFQNNERLKS